MTLEQLHRRWLEYNINGTGKPKLRISNGQRYVGNIFFYNGEPAARLVKRPFHGWCKLYKWTIANIPDDFKSDAQSMCVDSLGVWSRFDEDQISDEDLHSRIQFLLVSEMVEYVDETIDSYTDESMSHKNAVMASTRQLDIWNEKYVKYSSMFDLHWPDLPRSFWDQAKAKAQAKYDRFNDPVAVTKRERAKARRMAMKALGLLKKSA